MWIKEVVGYVLLGSEQRPSLRQVSGKVEKDEKVFITRNGRCIAVMLSMDSYNERSSTKHTVTSKEIREIEKEMRIMPDGKGVRKSSRHQTMQKV